MDSSAEPCLMHIAVDALFGSVYDMDIWYSYAPISALTEEMLAWIDGEYEYACMTARDGFLTLNFHHDDDIEDGDFSEEYKRGRDLAKKVFKPKRTDPLPRASICRAIEVRRMPDFM